MGCGGNRRGCHDDGVVRPRRLVRGAKSGRVVGVEAEVQTCCTDRIRTSVVSVIENVVVSSYTHSRLLA